MKDDLINIIKKMDGNVFTLGIVDKDIINAVQNNKNIKDYLMLNINSTVNYENTQNCKPVKKVKISKIKKKNKKKKIDYTVCEISDCKDYFKTFINDTIYFNKKNIYYYGDTSSYELDTLIKKYRRYNVNIEVLKYPNNEFILKIDTTKAKTNRLKAFIYRMNDNFLGFIDFLSDFLTS